MNATAAKIAIENFNKEQISKATFIKNNAIKEIENLESEILKLKKQLKIQKSIIKEANKDIENYE